MTVLIFFFVSYFFSYDVKKSIISVTSNAVGSDCLTLIMMLPILDETLRNLPHNILAINKRPGSIQSFFPSLRRTPGPLPIKALFFY